MFFFESLARLIVRPGFRGVTYFIFKINSLIKRRRGVGATMPLRFNI